jgi:hypothetical protein
MNTLSPPNRVTARGVWRKTTFFSPQSGVISLCTVLKGRGFGFDFRFSIFDFPVSAGAAAMKGCYGVGLCTVKSKSRAGKGGF